MNNKKELIANISEHKNYIRKNDKRSPTARHFQLAGGSVVTGNGGWAVEELLTGKGNQREAHWIYNSVSWRIK